jgi:hypothetical protein
VGTLLQEEHLCHQETGRKPFCLELKLASQIGFLLRALFPISQSAAHSLKKHFGFFIVFVLLGQTQMQVGQVQAVVSRHLRDKEDLVVPLSHNSITLVLALLDKLLHSFMQLAPAQATSKATTVKKPKQKLNPKTTQQRWQALFPNNPKLTASPVSRVLQ